MQIVADNTLKFDLFFRENSTTVHVNCLPSLIFSEKMFDVSSAVATISDLR